MKQVTPALLLAVALDFDPVLVLRCQHADDRSLLLWLLVVGLLEHLDLDDTRTLIELPVEAYSAADFELANRVDHLLVGSATILRGAADPACHVAARLLLAVGLDLDPGALLGG